MANSPINDHLESLIRSEFNEAEFRRVKSLLESVTLNHVMARSETNLDNTRRAVLQLSKGNIKKLEKLISIAKLDFRDVIAMAVRDHSEDS